MRQTGEPTDHRGEQNPTRLLAFGMAGAAVLLAVSITIRPAGLSADDGLSYFGVYKTTVGPYAAAYFLEAACYWWVSCRVGPDQRVLTMSFKVMAPLIAALVVAPTSLVGFVHDAIGSILFCIQLALSIWLVATEDLTWQSVVLISIEFVSGLFALYYLQRHVGWLLQSQVVFQFAFGILMIRFLRRRRARALA